MKLLKLESKLERAKKKCNDIAEAVRGRTLVLVGEPDDGEGLDAFTCGWLALCCVKRGALF